MTHDHVSIFFFFRKMRQGDPETSSVYTDFVPQVKSKPPRKSTSRRNSTKKKNSNKDA